MYFRDVSHNRISGILPTEIFLLPYLQTLNVGYNQIYGDIPNDISNLKNLRKLYVC